MLLRLRRKQKSAKRLIGYESAADLLNRGAFFVSRFAEKILPKRLTLRAIFGKILNVG